MPTIDFHKDISLILDRNRDGSFSTRASRKAILHQVADELRQLGYYNVPAQGLKPKHIQALVAKWTNEGKSAGTLKNRMSHLRWLAAKIGKPAIVARNNSEYGINRRRYVTNISKSTEIPQGRLSEVRDEHLRTSLQLQAAFGLRREECIKFQPRFALNHDRPGYIRLKASWCKGGRERYIAITTEAQREALNQAMNIAGGGSLIPPERRYIDQLRIYEGECKRLGMSKLHGLRHAYAQARYRSITGWQAPAAGGPTSKRLSTEQKAIDRSARLQISQELGHERESITAVYLGR